MAKLLNALGLLTLNRVVETSALNLTGEYTGHSKKKVQDKMAEARGGVLFIDEAYTLDTSSFGIEAQAELIQLMSDPQYKVGGQYNPTLLPTRLFSLSHFMPQTSTVVIVAGYAMQMEQMMKRNPGFSNRFERKLRLKDWSDQDLSDLVLSRLEKGAAPDRPYVVADKAAIQSILNDTFRRMRLHTGVGFGNARDAVNLYHTILKSYFLRSGQERTAQGNAVMAPPPITGAPRFPSCHLPHLTRFAVADVRKAASQLFDSRVDTSLPSFTPQQAQELRFLNGAKIVTHSRGSKTSLEELRSFDIIGLYFSASWCLPCKTFTPTLAEYYQEHAKTCASIKFEIVFVSLDKDADSFHKYFSDMPWVAVEFTEGVCQRLSTQFDVNGVPTLVLINVKSGTFTVNGVELVKAGATLASSGILTSAAASTAHVAQELDSSAESGARIHAIQRKEAAKADVKDKAHASVPDRDLDFLRDHIRKIEARLRDAEGMHKEKLEEELRRTREQIDKIKLLDEVKAQALIEEEKQRLALMQRVVKKIGAIGRCPRDFAWRWEGNGFRCEGGSHYATPEELGVSAEDCYKFFSKTGVMEI